MSLGDAGFLHFFKGCFKWLWQTHPFFGFTVKIFFGGGSKYQVCSTFSIPIPEFEKNKMVGIVFKGVLEKQGKTENKHVLISLELENV